MAHFQVPPSGSFGPVKYPLGVWPSSAAGYRLFATGTAGTEMIRIEIGQTLKLQLTGARGSRIVSLDGTSAPSWPGTAPARKVAITDEVATSDAHVFSIKGTSKGNAILEALDARGTAVAQLFLSTGTCDNHPGMAVDLIADVLRSPDALRIHALQRMLHNNEDNVFNQKAAANKNTSNPADLTCGMVAHDRGLQVFIKNTRVAHDWYQGAIYVPLKQKVKADRSNLRYVPDKVASLASRVGARLRAGEAVRLAVVDVPELLNPVNGRLVAYYAGGHTVLAVGCNAANTEFLYIDPFFNGSMMRYEGGHATSRFGETCEQLGIMVVERDATRSINAADMRANIIRTKPSTYGTFKPSNGNAMEVVAGPFAGF
jgi:hypothetical protein